MRSLVTLALCSLVAVPTLSAQAALPYDVPQGWMRTQDPRTNLVTLTAPGVQAPHFCVITVFTPEAFAGTGQEFHELIVGRALGQAPALQPPQQGSVGAFVVTSIHQQLQNGLPLWSRIYTGRWADRGQAFILAADSPDLENRFAPVADAMMSRIALPSGPSQVATTPPAATPPQGSDAETPRGGSAFGDYIYTVPEGWTTTPSGNGLWIASPTLVNAAPSASGPWRLRAATSSPTRSGCGVRCSRDSRSGPRIRSTRRSSSAESPRRGGNTRSSDAEFSGPRTRTRSWEGRSWWPDWAIASPSCPFSRRIPSSARATCTGMR